MTVLPYFCRMSIVAAIQQAVCSSLTNLYGQPFTPAQFQVNKTVADFEGDYTVVLFGLVKVLRLSPDALGNQLGELLLANHPNLFAKFNIVKGFLNLNIADAYWIEVLVQNHADICYGKKAMNGKRVMVEYSSPNTNKPLHLGHLRNNFLGRSVAEILKANGYEMVKTCIVNDRGVHICKSMIAWQLFANGATPESAGVKGDHFVGDYYVQFNNELKKQLAPFIQQVLEEGKVSGYSNTDEEKIKKSLENITKYEPLLTKEIDTIDWAKVYAMGDKVKQLCEAAQKGEEKWKTVGKCFEDKEAFDLTEQEREKKTKELKGFLKNVLSLEEKIATERATIIELLQNYTAIMQTTQQMLLDWEAGKPEVMDLWRAMNQWVYDGFDVTYKRIGTDFDKIYYESNTYLLGKETVQDGLAKKVFTQRPDNSVWIDLTADGLDEKLVQRKDGTSVYITQDIGLAQQKYDEYKIDKSIYVIGNEQNYHMKVLQLICKHLGMPYADGIYHLSYGMVELPSGKMKSREGTVVDADDLLDEMLHNAEEEAKKNNEGKPESEYNKMSVPEKEVLHHIISTGSMKYYLLKVDPKKTMVFNPQESIEFTGFTGAYIQYTHARIKSILRKQQPTAGWQPDGSALLPLEKELLLLLEQYPAIIDEAGREYNPAVIAHYVYHLGKSFNSFYTEHPVATAETEEKKQLRLRILVMLANVINSSMALLGIQVPDRM